MEYVKVSVVEGSGFLLDPEAYLAVLPRIAPEQPLIPRVRNHRHLSTDGEDNSAAQPRPLWLITCEYQRALCFGVRRWVS
jgi:hypothetical protein